MKRSNKMNQFMEDLQGKEQSGPGSSKNYITPSGYVRLREELKLLLSVERPKVVEVVAWAASNGDRSENADYIYGKKRLREIDHRIRFLQKRIDSAVVVDPVEQRGSKVLFGATVTVLNDDGEEKTYCIVGMDETDLHKGRVSWKSPIGQALLQSQVGNVVTFKTPRGVEELEVVKVLYVSLE